MIIVLLLHFFCTKQAPILSKQGIKYQAVLPNRLKSYEQLFGIYIFSKYVKSVNFQIQLLVMK